MEVPDLAGEVSVDRSETRNVERSEAAVFTEMKHPAAPQGPGPAPSGRWSRLWKRPPAVLSGVAILLAGLAAIASAAGVVSPASASADGPHAQKELTVNPGNGFGGGTIHYPADAQGKLPAVVIGPALGAGKGYYEWNAAKLASYGFVAFAIDTNSPGDLFTQRRDQMLAALDYLVNASPVSANVDGSRLAVEGHSASAVGALLAGVQRPSLKAVVSLAPVSAGIGANDVAGLTVPSLLVCGGSDGWAPPSQCEALANGMPANTPKQTFTVPGAGHGFPTGDNEAFPVELSWLQQHLAGGASSSPASPPQSSPASPNR
jgi:dienelactone hydrolase